MMGVGATLAPTVLYSLIDLARVYWNHLDAIEALLLYGDHASDAHLHMTPEDEEPEEDAPEWITDLAALMEDVDEDNEDPDDNVRRPGLLMLVQALDADLPLDAA